ncbi:hypothetical protein PLESTB_001282300 [Pleodorina starrii]|uniref:Aminotransferase class I/classII large domain-containing protein n=1 Tax=Pleodorina starrii TaxID=330485 RepID=A0A9W6BU71_9CHLO|nr:hypothetical protein PLESTM_001943300 [Pleodorina starrii]GLC57862.1 hypothetical protein PLESTB_001282300 [Pleodorina starrii]GLC69931.1 hypothetical protein PLESTF_000900000 [Pleodorina starrii]
MYPVLIHTGSRLSARLLQQASFCRWITSLSKTWSQEGMSQTFQKITSQRGDYVARQVGDELVDFSVGQPSPTMLPLQALVAATSHRLASPDAELLLQYGPRQGYRSFRQSLSTFLSARYGTAVHPDHLMVTAGVSHGLGLAVGRLARPGDLIVVECPTYFLVTPIFRDNHLTVVPMPTDEYGMVVEELERWLRQDPSHRPRLVYTIPIHNNPRGATLPPDRRRTLMRLAAEYDFVVLADEVYQLMTFPGHDHPSQGNGGGAGGPDGAAADGSDDKKVRTAVPAHAEAGCSGAGAAAAAAAAGESSPYTAGGERRTDDGPPASGVVAAAAAAAVAPPPPLRCQEGDALPLPLRCYEEECDPRDSRVVSFGSFSKMLAPALRLGWLECTNPALLQRCREDGVVSSGGCIAQLATGLAHSALELGLQAAHLDGVVRPQLAARCTALVSALRRYLPPGSFESLVEPRGGYFLWLELRKDIDSRRLLSLAESRHGVRFTPGPNCGGGPPHCLRLAFSFYNEAELEEGARRLGAAVRDYTDQQEAEKGSTTAPHAAAGAAETIQ